jgi:Cu-Zn family superoxide dismutase
MKILASTLLTAALALSPACKKDEEKPATTDDTTTPDTTAPDTPPPAADAAAAASPKAAMAELKPTKGSKVAGTVTFTEKDGQIEMVAAITGLAPGEHGFHIHEKGDCSAPDATSAGGHFNPGGHPHAAPEADAKHAGDLGNLTADDSGAGNKTMMLEHISLGEGEADVVGKAVIVHEKADDLKTQPTGDAGGRLACGVIEMQDAAAAPAEPAAE